MNPRTFVTIALGLCAIAFGAYAHDDHAHEAAPAQTAAAAPTMEAHSESFELVATLEGEGLSVWIDRFDTNEPVLQAKVEVEAGDLRASGTFHADHGDYAFTDEKLLAKLREPGEHALVFTVHSGQQSDLLAGTLLSTSDEHSHGLTWPLWIGAGAALLAVAAIAWLLMRRRRERGAAL